MNLPNKITLSRIALIPLVVVVYLVAFPLHKYVAGLLFALICVTDFLDGSIARKRNEVTDLGKFLDPIADKVIVVVMIFLFVGDGTLAHPWGAVVCGIIMSREFIVSAFRLLASSKGVVIAADVWGKVKTILLDIGIAVLTLSEIRFFAISGKIIFYAGALLTVYSGINYIYKNRQVLESVNTKDEFESFKEGVDEIASRIENKDK